MDRPDLVSLVMPPTIITAWIFTHTKDSQYPIFILSLNDISKFDNSDNHYLFSISEYSFDEFNGFSILLRRFVK